MRVMTYNIKHGEVFGDAAGRIDLAPTAERINALGCDIVALNEVRGVSDEPPAPGFLPQTEILSELTGLHGLFAPAIRLAGKGLYGNALLSRYPVLRHEIIPLPSPREHFYAIHRYEDRCLLKAVLAVGTEAAPREMTVLVCHMGLNPDERIVAVKAICRELDATEGDVILMGDFNMTPGNELLVPIRMRMTDAADVVGLTTPTYPSDHPSVKIDYIFVSSALRVTNAAVVAETVSDHRAHMADIEE